MRWEELQSIRNRFEYFRGWTDDQVDDDELLALIRDFFIIPTRVSAQGVPEAVFSAGFRAACRCLRNRRRTTDANVFGAPRSLLHIPVSENDSKLMPNSYPSIFRRLCF